MKIVKGGWVLACDGRKALLLENVGDAVSPELRIKEAYEHGDEPTRELGAAPPGRTYQSVGSHRSAVEQTDLHKEAERGFLRGLAESLNRAAVDGDAKALIVVAPPRALGTIREAYSPALRDVIVGEIAKDVVNRPTKEIQDLVMQGE
ncbi:MAG: host attachment family protein [Xanthobacteraceae bacterium]|nr:host attachment family protein [Xanthobacteraceae bacterium]